MPVRFRCQNCHRRISGSQRKIGGVVTCPVCGQPTSVIPEGVPAGAVANVVQAAAETEGPASLAAAGSNGHSPAAADFNDVAFIVAEGGADAVARGDSAVEAPPFVAPQIVPSDWRPSSAIPAADKITSLSRRQISVSQAIENYVLVSRRALYVQGLLFCLVSAVAGLLGFFVGQGRASRTSERIADAATETQQVEIIKGAVAYSPELGKRAGDRHALVFILPPAPVANLKIESAGLTPADAGAQVDRGLTNVIETLGGTLAKADANGQFQTTLRPVEQQRVLVVSRSAERPAGQNIDPVHLAEMRDYFAAPAEIIGPYRYLWLRQKVNGATPLSLAFE